MAFEKFTQTGRSFAPKASISTYGTLSFNDGARRRYQMDDYTHCILYYDRDTHRVGIELTNDGRTAGARTLRHRRTGFLSLAMLGAWPPRFRMHTWS